MTRTGMKKTGVLLLAVALSTTILLSGCVQKAEKMTETVYNVYFGLNDADTGKLEIAMEDASAYIRSVIESYGYGYTEHRAYGAYTEDGVSRGNDTLVYMLIFVDEEKVREISDQVIGHLNLASVLCQKEEMEYAFFVGEEKQNGRKAGRA